MQMFFFIQSYPIPQDEQLEALQLPQADELDDFTEVSPAAVVVLLINPQADISRVRSWLSHSGHWGTDEPITRVSKSVSQ